MDVDFIGRRITALRITKGISEYKMSLDLGHSKSYIQSIASGRALPSMSEFLFICDYLGVSPKDFFDTEKADPGLINELMDCVKDMPSEDLIMLIELARRLGKS